MLVLLLLLRFLHPGVGILPQPYPNPMNTKHSAWTPAGTRTTAGSWAVSMLGHRRGQWWGRGGLDDMGGDLNPHTAVRVNFGPR